MVTETTHDTPVTELGQHPRRRQESIRSSSNTGHVAVVTGASSETGATTARALTAGGYRVALLARRADRSQALAEELSGSAIAIEADVPDCDLLVAVAQCVQEGLGGADVLVDHAGGMLLGAFISEQRQMGRVNLCGAMTAAEVFSTSSATAEATW